MSFFRLFEADNHFFRSQRQRIGGLYVDTAGDAESAGYSCEDGDYLDDSLQKPLIVLKGFMSFVKFTRSSCLNLVLTFWTLPYIVKIY